MPRKIRKFNDCIKSIEVVRKDPRLAPGSRVWFGSRHDAIEEVEILEYPYWSVFGTDGGRNLLASVGKFPGHGLWRLRTMDPKNPKWIRTTSLADDGFPGYQYDDRPCLINKTKEEAFQAREKHTAWFDNTYTGWSDYDSYDF